MARNNRIFRRVRPQFLAAAVLAAGLAGCTMAPGGQPTPTPVSLNTYQPGATPQAASAVGPAAGTLPPQPAADANAAGAQPSSAAAAANPAAAQAAPAQTDSTQAAAAAPAGATYSAEIAADKQVVIAAQVNGQIQNVLIDVGNRVHAGDVLVQLDSAALQAQRAQAMASMEAAKSQLDLLRDPAKAQDLAAAEAAVNAAAAAYSRAKGGPTDEERRQALAGLKQAEAAVSVAQAAYNRVKGDPLIGILPQSLQLEQATLAKEGAQAQYDKVMKGATADQVAGAYAQLENAQAALQRLKDGAKPAQIAAAEAQVHAAENAFYLAQLQVDKAAVKSPIDGIASRVYLNVGALAAPGTPLVSVLSDQMRVTISVEESRLPSLKIGQKAVIRAEAYPDRTFDGVVSLIAPELDQTTRTVQVTIRPSDPAGLLRPGMSATAELLD